MKTLMLATIAFGLILSGCKKNEENNVAPAGSTSPSMLAYVTQQRTAATQTFTFMGSGGGYFEGSKGTLLAVNPLAFRDAEGLPVAGPVTLELVEAYSVGDMVRLNMRTVADVGGQRVPLQSGGELRLRATSNGEQVAVAEDGVLIYAPYDQFPVDGMRPYIGEEDADGNVLWGEVGDPLIDTTFAYSDNTGAVQDADSGYVAWWPPPQGIWPPYTFFNIDNPLPSVGPVTDVTVHLSNIPSNYGTQTFLVLPDLDCMIYFEAGTLASPSAGCDVPLNAQGTIVSICITGEDEFSAAFAPITVTQDHQQTVTLQPMTEAAYHAALDAL